MEQGLQFAHCYIYLIGGNFGGEIFANFTTLMPSKKVLFVNFCAGGAGVCVGGNQ